MAPTPHRLQGSGGTRSNKVWRHTRLPVSRNVFDTDFLDFTNPSPRCRHDISQGGRTFVPLYLAKNGRLCRKLDAEGRGREEDRDRAD